MNSLWLAMVTFALVGAVTPGPVNLLALRHGLSGRIDAPAAFVFGASGSYALVVWLTGQATDLLLTRPLLIELTRWAGGLYLLWLAWKIATAPVADLSTDPAEPPGGAGTALLEGSLTQMLNPKAWLVALSGIGLFVVSQPAARSALVQFCLISLLACLTGVGTWALAGRWLTRWLQSARQQQWLNRLLAGLLTLSIIGVLQ